MRRRTLLRMGITALAVASCAVSSESASLTGPGLIFVYTDN
jgi:hypothetical protein